MKFRLRQVEGFLALASTLSFSRAAELLHMTQPAFSQMIREMEQALELQLFVRTTRRVELSDAGQRLQHHFRRGLDSLEDAWRDARAIASLDQGELAVGVLPSLACGLVMDVLSQYRSDHPGVSIRLYEDHNRQILEQLSAGKVELAVGSDMPFPAAVDFEPLFRDELVCILPDTHRLAKRQRIAWTQLADEPIILVAATSQTNLMVRQTLQRLALGKHADYQTLNSVTALSMVRSGFGLTFIPEIALSELNMTGLVARRMGRPYPDRTVGLFHRSGHGLSPAAQRFREKLKARLSQFQTTG